MNGVSSGSRWAWCVAMAMAGVFASVVSLPAAAKRPRAHDFVLRDANGLLQER